MRRAQLIQGKSRPFAFHRPGRPPAVSGFHPFLTTASVPNASRSHDRMTVRDAFSLSPLQQGMLFDALADAHCGVDIEQLVVHLDEPLDVARFVSAWERLVQRHDMLRARFVLEGAAPRQEILDSAEPAIAIHHTRVDDPDARRRDLAEFLDKDRREGFDITAGIPQRLNLFQWDPQTWTIVWTFHHALLDGRAFPVILAEAFQLYEELAHGEPAPRSAPPRYRSYIEWIERHDPSPAERYWKDLLAGFAAPTPLTVDLTTRADDDADPLGEAWASLDVGASARLHAMARTRGVTVNTCVMAAWAMLLHRYSGEDDVVFGATRACRHGVPQGAEIVGLLINTLPVRVRFRSGMAASDVCTEIRRQWLAARGHEHLSLARVKALSDAPAHQPLFETLVVYERQQLDTGLQNTSPAWKKRRVELHEMPAFPIALAAYDGDELTFKLSFDTRRLHLETMRRMAGHLRCLLEHMAAAPDTTVAHLPLLTPEERAQLLQSARARVAGGSSRLPADGEATLAQLFEAAAAARPNAFAIRCEDRSLTYAELDARANRIARAIGAEGTPPRAIVGLCLDRTINLVAAIIGVLKAGCAYLPIDPAYPHERVAFMLDDARVPVVLTDASLVDRLPPGSHRVLDLTALLSADAAPVQPNSTSSPAPAITADDLAYVIYTSGTTGKPKGSMITHRNVVRLFASTEAWYGFDSDDVWTLFHSSAFDFSVWEIWGALLYGGHLVVVPFLVSRSPESFYALLAREQVTVLNQTPSAFRQLMQAEDTIGQRALALRYVIFGGEALEPSALRPWFDRHGDETPRLVNMYGITETTVHVTYRVLKRRDLSAGSVIGVPIPDLHIYILDGERELVPVGVPGEIYVGGAGLAPGYLNRDELTAERFIPDPFTATAGARVYKTGDRARWLANGDIEYLGRLDEQVKIRGFRIEPGEVESVLGGHPAVRESLVMARDDEGFGKRLVAYVTTRSAAPAIDEIRAHLQRHLPEYMVPAAFVFVAAFPLTSNGKIDRRALPPPRIQRPETGSGYVAPRTPAEHALAAIWRAVLRVDRVGVTDNFYALGGDSILSLHVLSRARAAGLTLTPREFFAHHTIEELARLADVPHEPDRSRSADHHVTSRDESVALSDALVPLAPIQYWFAEQHLEDDHHYNQAFLFETLTPLERGPLQRALDALQSHHQAFGLRIDRSFGAWTQIYKQPEEPAALEWVTLDPDTSPEQRTACIEAIAAAAQARLDFEHGPIWRAVYFDLGPGVRSRLLIVVHHLAIDGASWRTLVEDLGVAYAAACDGHEIRLPHSATPYHAWTERLAGFAASRAIAEEVEHWRRATEPAAVSGALATCVEAAQADARESASRTLTARLTADETAALLQRVPIAYNTQINDALLTALARACARAGGGDTLWINLEAHGREHFADDLDVSRTVGWFTSIFPVRLIVDAHDTPWDPGRVLTSVKEQLRRIPQRGLGYGVLRYLAGTRVLPSSEPPLVVNYLGQLDQLVADSPLLRLAPDSTGPWHSEHQRRRYPVALNCAVVGHCFEVQWTASARRDAQAAVRRLNDELLTALRELIAHCQAVRTSRRTPSDFPLAGLNQASLDRLTAAAPDLEDVYPLSPMQKLFVSAGRGSADAAFDQWHCTLGGPLDMVAFCDAWHDAVRRHPVLRSAVHVEHLAEPLQVVHRDVRMSWTIEDWRHLTHGERDARWPAFLERDRRWPLRLDRAPLMRFALIRLDDATWKFCWSAASLLLDGWSWPLVFADVSRAYEARAAGGVPSLDAVRPYRDYIGWLTASERGDSEAFWRAELAGFTTPTPLPPPDSYEDESWSQSLTLAPTAARALQAMARRLHVTVNSVVQAAWSVVLGRQAGTSDVVFGAAFSGRPADLAGADRSVGPFVTNLPVRVTVRDTDSFDDLCRAIHARLLRLAPHQFLAPAEIQRVSQVSWRDRLFGSLVVFQNHGVNEAASRIGTEVSVSEFAGPIHSGYPVLLLVEPSDSLRLTLMTDPRRVSTRAAQNWVADLVHLLEQAPQLADRRLAEIARALRTTPVTRSNGALPVARCATYAAPKSEMERTIADIWGRLCGGADVGIDDNFLDMGGTSLLLVQFHDELRRRVAPDLSIVTLFAHATVRTLSVALSPGTSADTAGTARRRLRAERQRYALALRRERVKH